VITCAFCDPCVRCCLGFAGKWAKAARWLIDGALGGERASVAQWGVSGEHGDVAGWGCWSESDGSASVDVQNIGNQTSFSVGVQRDNSDGAFGAAGVRRLFVDVVADAALGPSKVCA
jgi:hypothetical protein